MAAATDSETGEVLLRAEGLASGYGGMQVLSDVDLEIREGEMVVLLGANGAGKTTLLKALLSLLPLHRGRISFKGRDVTRLRTDQKVRMGLGYMSEGAVFPDLTVEENLSMGGYRLSSASMRTRKRELYTALPVLEQRSAYPGASLSGGQRKMLGFAKALMSRPELLVLDEPSAGLAPRMVNEMIETLAAFHSREGVAMLIAEQNISFMGLASRGYVLDNGHVVAHGTVSELQNNDVVREAYLGPLED